MNSYVATGKRSVPAIEAVASYTVKCSTIIIKLQRRTYARCTASISLDYITGLWVQSLVTIVRKSSARHRGYGTGTVYIATQLAYVPKA